MIASETFLENVFNKDSKDNIQKMFENFLKNVLECPKNVLECPIYVLEFPRKCSNF